MKFAVASQEGVVAVWDVRSTKPIKVIQTDKTRLPAGQHGNGEANSMLSDDPWDWTRGNSKAPGWGARSVKFGAGGTHGRPGHEIMTFTEVKFNFAIVARLECTHVSFSIQTSYMSSMLVRSRQRKSSGCQALYAAKRQL